MWLEVRFRVLRTPKRCGSRLDLAFFERQKKMWLGVRIHVHRTPKEKLSIVLIYIYILPGVWFCHQIRTLYPMVEPYLWHPKISHFAIWPQTRDFSIEDSIPSIYGATAIWPQTRDLFRSNPEPHNLIMKKICGSGFDGRILAMTMWGWSNTMWRQYTLYICCNCHLTPNPGFISV